MALFLVFDEAGRIMQRSEVTDAAGMEAVLTERGLSFLNVDNAYFVDGAVKARPVLTPTLSKTRVTADGSDFAVIGGVPEGAAIMVSGPATISETADGSDLELTFTTPGIYRVTIDAFPYRVEPIQIEAV